MDVGDLMGTPTFELGSVAGGWSAGTLADDNVFEVGGKGDGAFLFPDRVGLRSCTLFFRDLMAAFTEDDRELVVRGAGPVGEGSRDCSGEAWVDEATDVAEV